VLCPVFTALAATAAALAGSSIAVGAQDMFWKESGAYTGEVSAPMLRDAGALYVILGHSERRHRFGSPEADIDGPAGDVFGDNDLSVQLKLKNALKHGMIPIVCVGEILAEREAGQTNDVVGGQTRAALQGLSEADAGKIVLAYEPVWAIGTGKTCEASQANEVCGFIRQTVAETAGKQAAAAIRIQYGGSVKADNAQQILGQSDIDGALVGGASLQPASFAAIVRAAA
jgi:triosephosphate isomerase